MIEQTFVYWRVAVASNWLQTQRSTKKKPTRNFEVRVELASGRVFERQNGR